MLEFFSVIMYVSVYICVCACVCVCVWCCDYVISSLCAAESRAQKAKVGVWRKEVYRDETDGTSVFRRVWQWLQGKLKWKKSV